jgi:hypothetical protein
VEGLAQNDPANLVQGRVKRPIRAVVEADEAQRRLEQEASDLGDVLMGQSPAAQAHPHPDAPATLVGLLQDPAALRLDDDVPRRQRRQPCVGEPGLGQRAALPGHSVEHAHRGDRRELQERGIEDRERPVVARIGQNDKAAQAYVAAIAHTDSAAAQAFLHRRSKALMGRS